MRYWILLILLNLQACGLIGTSGIDDRQVFLEVKADGDSCIVVIDSYGNKTAQMIEMQSRELKKEDQ